MMFDGLHNGTVANWVAHIYFQMDLVKAAGMNTAYTHIFFMSIFSKYERSFQIIHIDWKGFYE